MSRAKFVHRSVDRPGSSWPEHRGILALCHDLVAIGYSHAFSGNGQIHLLSTEIERRVTNTVWTEFRRTLKMT